MILVVIITAAIISVILIKTSLSSLTQLLYTNTSMNTLESKFLATGCLHEALINLNRNHDYSGETHNLSYGTCIISISGSDNTRNVNVQSEIGNYYLDYQASVQLKPFSLLAWDN